MKRTKSNFEQMQIEHMEINYFVNFCKINKLFIYFALLFSFRYILRVIQDNPVPLYQNFLNCL